MEMVRPMKQTTWSWPAVINFTLGGMASGFYLLSLLVVILQDGLVGASQPAAFKLVAPAVAGLGFLVLTLEAGRPWRSRYLLRHLGRSWMSRETLAGAIFIPTAVLDWFWSQPLLWGLAAVAALSLMISQGFIIYRARAVTAWNVPPMPLLFVTSGFATGSGLMLLVATNLLILAPGMIGVAGLIWLVLDLAVWFFYLHRYYDTAFWEATQVLRHRSSLLLTVGVGHLLPILLLAVLALFPDLGAGLLRITEWLAGLAIIIGGTAQKAGIIMQAGYLRSIVLGRENGHFRQVSSSLPISSPVIRQNEPAP
jgi:DMSO reductase anchor subunit